MSALVAMMTRALLLLGVLSVANSHPVILDLQGASSRDQLQSMKQEMQPFAIVQSKVQEMQPFAQPMENERDAVLVHMAGDPSECNGLYNWCRNSGHYDWFFCTQAYVHCVIN